MEDKLSIHAKLASSSAIATPFIELTVKRHLEGMWVMSALILGGASPTEAATSLEVLKLCGSKRSAFRYWGKIRRLPHSDWEKTIQSSLATDRGAKSRKTLAAEVTEALECAQKVSKHLKISELYRVALEASRKAGVECPSNKWFGRHFIRSK